MNASTIPDHATSANATTKKGVLAGFGLALVCAVACSVPLIAAGGVAAGVGAFFTGGVALALGVVALVAVVVGAALWLRGRRAAAATTEPESTCGCGGAC